MRWLMEGQVKWLMQDNEVAAAYIQNAILDPKTWRDNPKLPGLKKARQYLIPIQDDVWTEKKKQREFATIFQGSSVNHEDMKDLQDQIVQMPDQSSSSAIAVKVEGAPKAQPKPKGKASTDPALITRKGQATGTTNKKADPLKPIKTWLASLQADIVKMKDMLKECGNPSSSIPVMIRDQYRAILEEGIPRAVGLRQSCQESLDGDRAADDALKQELESAKTSWLETLQGHISSFAFLTKARDQAARAAKTAKSQRKS